MNKPCLEPGCGRLSPNSRCLEHTRAKDRARGTRQQRGYDTAHDQARAAAIATYDPADLCWRCRQPLGSVPGLLDLGHVDGDRSRHRGLEHRACNRGRREPAFLGQ